MHANPEELLRRVATFLVAFYLVACVMNLVAAAMAARAKRFAAGATWLVVAALFGLFAALSLAGVAQNITCPIYIVNGRLDRIVPAADAERLAREVKGPVTLMMIEDGNHIATNRAYRWRSQSADWMGEQLR